MRILSILIAGAMVFVFAASAKAGLIKSAVGTNNCLAIANAPPVSQQNNIVIEPCVRNPTQSGQ